MKATIVVIAALGCAALWAPVAAGAIPANDDFSAREAFGDALPVVVTRSNVDATKEAGEFLGTPFAAGHSVWFEWEAPASEWVTIGACDASFPSIIGVFTGTAVNALTPAVSGNTGEGTDCPFAQRQYAFKAASGTIYKIAVDGNSFYLPPASPPVAEGTFTLRIDATPPPPNDSFVNPTRLEGRIDEEPDGNRIYFANVQGHNRAATKEIGEPNHNGNAGGASVWYSWTAPETGVARIGVCCAGPGLLALYVGDGVGSLVAIGPGPGSREVPVVGGTTYRIAVDGEFDSGTGEAEMGSFSVSAFMSLAPGPGFLALPAPLDRIGPSTTLSRATVRPGKRSATFRFGSNELGSFRCRLDRRPFVACGSPTTYKGLKVGRHTFEVVATDMAGNRDASPAVARIRLPKPKRPKAKG